MALPTTASLREHLGVTSTEEFVELLKNTDPKVFEERLKEIWMITSKQPRTFCVGPDGKSIITKEERDRLLPTHGQIKAFDNGRLRVLFNWLGEVDRNVFEDYWPVFKVTGINILEDGAEAIDPELTQTFRHLKDAEAFYLGVIATWTDSQPVYDEYGKLVKVREVGNKLAEPEPPDPDLPTVTTTMTDYGTW
jgi:hypothetical protein